MLSNSRSTISTGRLGSWPVMTRRSAEFKVTAPGAGSNHRALLQGGDRRSGALQAIEKRWRLCRIDEPASCLRRGRLVRPDIKVR